MTALLVGLLYLAPALLIAAALLRGRYPGERILIAAVGRARRRRRPARRDGCARRRRTAPPRGGRLIAARMAGRAPPRTATCHSIHRAQSVPAGTHQVLSVRVPNEEDNAATTKVRLIFPPGFDAVSYEPQAGWRAHVVRRRLARPVQTENGPVTSEVGSIAWTGSKRGLGRIAPGQFRDFRISVRVPGKAGDVLTFRALQTYSDGEVVRWTGRAAADKPAPTVTVTAAEAAHGATARTGRAQARAAHTPVVRRTPAPGSTAHGVKRVAIVFGQRLVTGKIDVYRGSTRVTPSRTGPSGAAVSASFRRARAAGGYTARWRAVAEDGHVQTGSWSFKVR